MSETLRDHRFTDLYLGSDYADMAVAPGSHAERRQVPEGLLGDVALLKAVCEAELPNATGSSFAVRHDEVLYRVNVIHDARDQKVFILRRVSAEIMDFNRLGIPPSVRELLLDPKRKGLIVFAGDQRSGKTTSAASLLSARLKAFGGFALAIEDPTETELEGLHGEGRCIQSPATEKQGGYREQLRRAMRTGVGTILIGEIRCQDSAVESIRQAINGLTVVSTVHSSSVPDALARMVAYANMEVPNAKEILAMGLTAVVHQTMERTANGGIRVLYKTLKVADVDETAIRQKIREGRLADLNQEVASQQARETYK